MDVKIISEEGMFWCPRWVNYPGSREYHVQDTNLREFYYSKVVWIDSLKFLAGDYYKSKEITTLVEVSTGAVAVCEEDIQGKVSLETLIEKYKEKLAKHKASCGEQVVSEFKLKNTVQLWQTKLWAL